MNYRKLFVVSLISILSISCNSQNCLELKNDFVSYEDAKELINTTDFTFSDKCNTSKKSSWILNAEYYSCDERMGYFLIKTKNKIYIHKGLPKKLWNEFKSAESFGKFYNSKIKGKYQLIIQNNGTKYWL